MEDLTTNFKCNRNNSHANQKKEIENGLLVDTAMVGRVISP